MFGKVLNTSLVNMRKVSGNEPKTVQLTFFYCRLCDENQLRALSLFFIIDLNRYVSWVA